MHNLPQATPALRMWFACLLGLACVSASSLRGSIPHIKELCYPPPCSPDVMVLVPVAAAPEGPAPSHPASTPGTPANPASTPGTPAKSPPPADKPAPAPPPDTPAPPPSSEKPAPVPAPDIPAGAAAPTPVEPATPAAKTATKPDIPPSGGCSTGRGQSDADAGPDSNWVARVLPPPTFPGDEALTPSPDLAKVDAEIESRQEQLDAINQWVASARDARDAIRDNIAVANETRKGLDAELRALAEQKRQLQLRIKQDRLEIQRAKAREQLARVEELMSVVTSKKAEILAKKERAKKKVDEYLAMQKAVGPTTTVDVDEIIEQHAGKVEFKNR